MGVLCLSLFCYALLCVHSSFAIILKRKRKLVTLLFLSHRCIVTIKVLWLFLTVQYVIEVFPDHTHLIFCLFCCFTSQVNNFGHGGTVSSPYHTFSWASLNKQLPVLRAHTFACNWQQPFLNDSAEGRGMAVEIIS